MTSVRFRAVGNDGSSFENCGPTGPPSARGIGTSSRALSVGVRPTKLASRSPCARDLNGNDRGEQMPAERAGVEHSGVPFAVEAHRGQRSLRLLPERCPRVRDCGREDRLTQGFHGFGLLPAALHATPSRTMASRWEARSWRLLRWTSPECPSRILLSPLKSGGGEGSWTSRAPGVSSGQHAHIHTT